MKSVYHCYPVRNLDKAEQDLSIWENYLKCFFQNKDQYFQDLQFSEKQAVHKT